MFLYRRLYRPVLMTALLVLLVCAGVTPFFVQAQAGIPQSGVDSASGLSYVELKRPDWTHSLLDLRTDGEAIAITDETGLVQLYDETFQEIGQLVGHTKEVIAINWSSDGYYIATGSRDTTVRVWDATTQTSLFTLPHTHDVYAIAWSPDGKKLATLEGVITDFTEDHINVYSNDNLHVFDIENNGVEIYTFDFHNAVSDLSWSPDSTKLASSGSTSFYGWDLLIWDIPGRTLIHEFPYSVSQILSIVWSPDGSKIAYGTVGSFDGAAIIIDAVTGGYLNSIGGWGTVTALAWNSSGGKLAIGTDGYANIRVLDLPTNNILELTGHKAPIRTLSWSKNGTRLSSLDSEGAARIWNMSNLPDLSGTPTVTPRPSLTPAPTATPTPQ